MLKIGSVRLEQTRDSEAALNKLRKRQVKRHIPTPFYRLNWYIKRYRDLRVTRSPLEAFSDVISPIVTKHWHRFIHRTKNASERAPQKVPGREKTYAIHVAGGLGDALVIARFVRDFQQFTHHIYNVDIYFYSPEGALPFFKNIKGFHQSLPGDSFAAAAPEYLFALYVSHHIVLVEEHVKYDELRANCPAILECLARVKAGSKGIEYCIKHQPYLDGIFADWAVQQGYKRHNHLHALMGVPYGGDALALDVDKAVPERLGLQPKGYVTIHDGWDNNLKLKSQRPTKALPWNTWVAIVENIKKQRPDLVIVQLGASTGDDIPGVDVNLRKKLSLSESTSVLAFSALHIDVESGLVHLGAALRVKSIVLFGPTNIEWFGYSENVNVAPKQCGNCWRATDKWMDVCALGHETPICMSGVDAKEVAMHALSMYNGTHAS